MQLYTQLNLFAVPPGYIGITNATEYAISVPDDIPLGTDILNYNIYIDRSAFSILFSVILTISQSPEIEAVLGYDNNDRSKTISVLPEPIVGDTIVITESIFNRAVIPDRLFIDNVASFMFNLNTIVVGNDFSGDLDSHDYDALVFVTITRPPGKFYI